MAPLRMIPLGGCPVTIPAGRLFRRKMVDPVFYGLGFKRLSHTLTSGHAVQLIRMCRGEIFIPPIIRDICYTTPPGTMPEDAKNILAGAEIILMEMSSPIEIVYDGFIFNQNRLREYVTQHFQSCGAGAVKAASTWVSCLQKGDAEGVAALGVELREFYVRSGANDDLLLDIIARATPRHLHTAEMINGLAELCSLIPQPIGLVLHNFQYMPDARPVIWPAGFKNEVLAVALHFDIPVYDPAGIVSAVGTQTAMAPDLRHYNKDFYEVMADEYMQFASSILGRALSDGHQYPLKSGPASLEDQDVD